MRRRGRYKPKAKDVQLLTEYISEKPHLVVKFKPSKVKPNKKK